MLIILIFFNKMKIEFYKIDICNSVSGRYQIDLKNFAVHISSDSKLNQLLVTKYFSIN